MAIAERVNRRVAGFLDLWDKGTIILFGFGIACAVVSTSLHFTYLKPQLGNVSEAVAVAVLFELSRMALLLFTGLTHCVHRGAESRLGRVFFGFALFLSFVSFVMDVTLVFRSGLRPTGVGDFFSSGCVMIVVLLAILEICLFAGFWLPIALHSRSIGAILERKHAEEEAVIAHIYELRAQRIREGRVDLAGHGFFNRVQTLLTPKKEPVAQEPTQG